jgi:hypothetical protein
MDITVDKVSVDYLKSLPVDVFYFLIIACKVAIYKNRGNKELISKIYNLFLTFSKSKISSQKQTELGLKICSFLIYFILLFNIK